MADETTKKGKLLTFCLEGITAAVFTPFHSNGNVNLDPISAYIDCLVKDGVKNAFICGTNGEGISLSIEERKQVAETWIRVNNGRLKALVVNVGSSGIRDSQDLAVHAEKIGADAIASGPPFGFKPRNLDGLVEFVQQVAAQAPSTPFYYYHMNMNCSAIGDMEDFIETLGRITIPTFCGFKLTSMDIYELARCCRRPEGYQIASGHDPHILAALVSGSDVFISGTANFQAKLANRIIDAFKAGDLKTATKHYDTYLRNCDVLRKYGGGVALCKTITKLARIDLGPARIPLKCPTADIESKLKADLERVGFFENIN